MERKQFKSDQNGRRLLLSSEALLYTFYKSVRAFMLVKLMHFHRELDNTDQKAAIGQIPQQLLSKSGNQMLETSNQG